MASGMSIVDAIKKMSETNNRYLKYQYGLILRHIRKGTPFEETLMKVSIVPKKYHWVLAAYGMMSDKEKMYASIAAEVKENLTETIKKMATAINLVVLIMFAGILGYTYFTLMNSAMSLSRTAM
jgi:type II secretory pathway component PulF